jgi:allantoicase
VASSDDFYTAAQTLIRPDRARSMGEGWETRRRRDGGHDFVVLQLAFAGRIRRLIADTAHFRYNASASIAVYGCDLDPAPEAASPAWQPVVERTRLQPDTCHVLAVGLDRPVAAIRLDAYPDGGLSRLRAIGSVDPRARRSAGYRWFNSLPSGQALSCLADAGLPAQAAAEVAGQRPLAEHWLDRLRGTSLPGRADGTAHVAALAAMLEGKPG